MIRLQLQVQGVVQGVGFRPFADRLAKKLHLGGFIQNTPQGVTIEIEGEPSRADDFIRLLQEETPAPGFVSHVEVRTVPVLFQQSFSIIQSDAGQDVTTLIPADTATCDACVSELLDPSNRRFRHPFINCTACGPRYTIIRAIPYDRKMSAMAHFPMCEACTQEFHHIQSRRYHAQPVCCNDCGPRLQLTNAKGEVILGDPIQMLCKALQNGEIAAIKGIGGFHLACICDETSVQTLRQRKHRAQKPFALMCRDVETVKTICHVSGAEEKHLTSPARPIVLLEKKQADHHAHLSENAYLGVMLPYAPIHHLIFAQSDWNMLVMTSANESDLPMIRENEEALQKLESIADVFLLHDRDIDHTCDDSLVYIHDEEPCFVRRSRGYVPLPVPIRQGASVLACGAEQKASFCLSKNHYAFPSAHIGDLKSLETLEVYKKGIAHFETLFDIAPEAVVCDLHPDFLSTRFGEDYAKKHRIPLYRVQHHHAHMASCMAEHGLEGDAIGVIFDGTGLGTDGSIWGGEFLVGGYGNFIRAGSLSPFALLGGDRAAKDPVRCAASLLYAAGLPVVDFFPEHGQYEALLRANLGCHMTTSMGRLFDAVSAITGICTENSYDSRAPQLLQSAAKQALQSRRYDVSVKEFEGRMVLDILSLFRQIAMDVQGGASPSDVAAGFLQALSCGTAVLCQEIRQRTGLCRVVLSGGVFLNMDLLRRTKEFLQQEDFEVYTHHRVSPSDEGLSLGQLAIAQRRHADVSCNCTESDRA